MPSHLRAPTSAPAWLWALLGGAIAASVARLEPNLLEEGLLLHVGERLLEGDHLYRDIALVTGPVPFALTATLFAFFGEDVLVARAGVVVLQGLACGAVFAMARRAGSGTWAHAAAACYASGPVLLFPLLTTMFYTTVASSLAVIAAWLGLRGVTSARWAFAAGATVALVALSKQTVGLVLALALVPAVALCAPTADRVRHGRAVCAGGAATALLTLACFAALGDLGDFFRAMLARPAGETFAFPFINLWPLGELAEELVPREYYYVPETIYLIREGRPGVPGPLVLISQILYVLPFAALAATALRRLAGPLRAGVWLHTAALLALLANLFPRSDAGHLVFVAPLAAAHLFVIAPSFERRDVLLRWLPRVGALGVILVLSVGAWGVSIRLHRMSVEPSYGPRVPLRPVSPPKASRAVPDTIAWLRERVEPDEAIFVARAEPLLYFAAETRNPTPFTGMLQVWGVRHEQQDAILEALGDVRFVVMSDVDDPLYTFYADELPRVQDYLERHYRVPESFTGRPRIDGWMLVLERGPDRGATAVDLLDPTLAPEPWRLLRTGQRRPGKPPVRDLPTRQNRRPLAMTLGPGGGGLDFALRVPPGGRFQAGVGFRTVQGRRQPDGLRFSVSVSEGGAFETIAARKIVFRENGAGNTWLPLEADLSAWSGRRVTLRLAAERTRPGRRKERYALWASPRIARPPGAD
ncbi:MAG: hypothetical protein ACR2P8_16160 [Myxococcota bacterium]